MTAPHRKLTFIGYHGTSSRDVPAILAGINPPSGRNYGGWSQLGPGFYTTPDEAVATIFADNAVEQRGGVPVVLEVYVEDFEHLHGRTVDVDQWGNVPVEYLTEYDYLTAPISGMEWATQIKFNARAYRWLVVQPG